MEMDFVRHLLDHAMRAGLQLHGVNREGRPAISFDPENPSSEMARRRFMNTEGLLRELLRAAMIEECERRGLPLDLPPKADQSLAPGSKLVH